MPYIGKKPADIIATVIDTTTGTFSGEVDAGSLDVSGNADIDGITNLDNTDIDGTLNVQGETTLQTHLNMGDNDIIKLGDSADLQIYHDASNSYISDQGTGNLIIRATSFRLNNSADTQNMIVGTDNAEVSLFWQGSSRLNTKSDGVNITGELQSDSLDVDGNADISGQVNFHSNVVWDDNNKLIIGNGSDLQIYHDGSNSIIKETNGAGSLHIQADFFRVQDINGTETKILAQDNGYVKLYHNNEQKFTTTANGFDLGDATASVYTDFNILGASTGNYGAYLGFVSGGTTFGKIARYGRIQGGTSNDFFITSDSTNNLLFGINNVEKARLDTSGNLLVGTTDSSPENNSTGTSADNGLALTPYGYGSFSRYAANSGTGIPLFVNRTNADGVLVQFRKDGGTVGSIGVASSDLTIFSTTGNHKGLRFGNAQIVPTNNAGADSDNTTDLGGASNRFKDLYLSGGAYIGGTGSANKLDDYEEGTFTPTVGSTGTDPTVTYSMQEGNYTKIGRQVTITAEIRFSAYTDNGGSFRLEGIPFSVFGDTNYRAVGSIALANMAVDLTGDYSVLQLAWNSGNSMQVIQNNSVTSGDAETPTSKIDAGTRMRYQITYFTT
jgi:hypothetical protein